MLQPVTFTRDRHDVRMVQQPIQQSSGQCRVLSERRVPPPKRQVAGHDQATAFVQGGDHLEEQVDLLTIHRQVANLVNDQQAVTSRCAEKSPVTVMARLALQRALQPAWVDELFEREAGTQYQRELLFSTTVELMSVAVGLRPSLHAAAQACPELPVSVQALYDKIKRTEPHLVRTLVAGRAERLIDVLAPMTKGKAPVVPGYRLRIVDGNHLPAGEKRIKPLPGFRGAVLPGHSLVVHDPDLEMVVDLEPCEDAHTQECAVMPSLLERARPG